MSSLQKSIKSFQNSEYISKYIYQLNYSFNRAVLSRWALTTVGHKALRVEGPRTVWPQIISYLLNLLSACGWILFRPTGLLSFRS